MRHRETTGHSFQFTPLREGRPQRNAPAFPDDDFNSRPCERGDDIPPSKQRIITISIHAPARGATTRHRYINCNVEFQFTPLREGRPFELSGKAKVRSFNSRPCERGDRLFLTGCLLNKFQFTPLREGRQPYFQPSSLIIKISIHAPARGATFYLNAFIFSFKLQFTPLREGRRHGKCGRAVKNISIHAPARGATEKRGDLNATQYDFNSRPCERGDRTCHSGSLAERISIHAPARGATDL